MTRSGEISFFSSTPIEDIEALNNSATCIFKSSSGELAFNVFMKRFSFDRAAMEEHFNRDYVHSDEFPKASFQGVITDIDQIDLSVKGQWKVTVTGSLTIHGVTRSVEESGIIEILDDGILLSSTFSVTLSDYDVKVPSNFLKRISKEIEISVKASLEPYER